MHANKRWTHKRDTRLQQIRARRAFTLIELLVVIAIIALLAAILLPVFAIVREQARQSSTMSRMHTVYVGAKLYDEDEGHFPDLLFNYAEVPDNTLTPPFRPALAAESANVISMDQAIGNYPLQSPNGVLLVNRGYLFPEQVRDYVSFTNDDNISKTKTDTTQAYYPPGIPNLGLQDVTWTDSNGPPPFAIPPGEQYLGDLDQPAPFATFKGQPKLFYKMDSMDIGPTINPATGNVVKDVNGNIVYELHYSPNWTHVLGASDAVPQLKYRLPPSDRTIITYDTWHVVEGSSSVIVLLLSGTARKINFNQLPGLPLGYLP